MTATIIPFPTRSTAPVRLTAAEFGALLRAHGIAGLIKYIGNKFSITEEQ